VSPIKANNSVEILGLSSAPGSHEKITGFGTIEPYLYVKVRKIKPALEWQLGYFGRKQAKNAAYNVSSAVWGVDSTRRIHRLWEFVQYCQRLATHNGNHAIRNFARYVRPPNWLNI